MNHVDDPHFPRILQFIRQLGIAVEPRRLSDDTFLPGLELGPNCIYFDDSKLRYPGDMLHEAGHLAVATAEQRAAVATPASSVPWPTDGEEIVAILWSYAAALHLQVPLTYLFHPDGYKGNSEWLIENFTAHNFIGLPLLEWMGLALSPQRAEEKGVSPFPSMLKWLRD